MRWGSGRGYLASPSTRSPTCTSAEQYKARGFFEEVEHPQAGTYAYPGVPFKITDHQPALHRPAPLLGQHNTEVYVEMLKRSPQDLVKLRQAGVI